jgi:hypothetical protein
MLIQSSHTPFSSLQKTYLPAKPTVDQLPNELTQRIDDILRVNGVQGFSIQGTDILLGSKKYNFFNNDDMEKFTQLLKDSSLHNAKKGIEDLLVDPQNKLATGVTTNPYLSDRIECIRRAIENCSGLLVKGIRITNEGLAYWVGTGPGRTLSEKCPVGDLNSREGILRFSQVLRQFGVFKP